MIDPLAGTESDESDDLEDRLDKLLRKRPCKPSPLPQKPPAKPLQQRGVGYPTQA